MPLFANRPGFQVTQSRLKSALRSFGRDGGGSIRMRRRERMLASRVVHGRPEMSNQTSLIQPEQIEQAILLIRGQRVMLDRDLAALYGVTTGNLNKAVQRNLDRFPPDF